MSNVVFFSARLITNSATKKEHKVNQTRAVPSEIHLSTGRRFPFLGAHIKFRHNVSSEDFFNCSEYQKPFAEGLAAVRPSYNRPPPAAAAPPRSPRSLSLMPRWLSSSVQTLETSDKYSSLASSSKAARSAIASPAYPEPLPHPGGTGSRADHREDVGVLERLAP